MKGRLLKKAAALTLAALLVTGGVPVQPIAEYLNPAITASAAEYTQNPTTKDELVPLASSGTVSEAHVVKYANKEWYVIGYDGVGLASESGTMTLFLKGTLGKRSFSDNGSNVYSNSSIHSYLESYLANTENFTSDESGAVVSRVLSGGGSTGNSYSGHVSGDSVNAKLWLLSAAEARKIPQSIIKSGGDGDGWWLRSPGGGSGKANYMPVSPSGNDVPKESGAGIDYSKSIRAAMLLDLNSVIYSSETNTLIAQEAESHSITVSLDNDQGSVEVPPRADKGETVSFTIATAVGYEVETVKFNDTPISPLNGVYSFTMPDNDVTISVTFNQIYKVEDHIEQDGDTYTIKTAKGWEVFCDCVKSSAYYGFGNKTVKLGLDITDGVTVSAGIPGKPFLGTFDGDGHTLAVALNSTDEEWVAPFSFFNGSIKNLTVTGTIAGSTYAAGLTGFTYGGSIENVTVSADVSGSSKTGGITGYCDFGSLLVKDTVFNGTLQCNKDVCGLIGWASENVGYNQAITIENCLFNGTYTCDGEFHPITLRNSNSQFAYTDNGAYYTVDPSLSNNNYIICAGTRVSTITVDDDFTITANPTFTFNSVDYYAEGTTITLSRVGSVTGVSVNNGSVEVTDNQDGTYSFTMPAEDVSINGHFSINIDSTIHHGSVTVTVGTTENAVAANEGDTVTLTVTPDEGYLLGSVTAGNETVTKVDDTHYTFTMPESDVTVSAVFAPDPAHFSQDGDVYTIHDAAGWDVFCDLLAENANGYFTGKTVKLANDISVNRQAGVSNHDFTGTFDGNGKTLTFNYTGSEDYIAPFYATANNSSPYFRNLTVNGTINSTGKYAAGLIGHLYGNVTIENCKSNIDITAAENSGGFVGLCEHTVNFTNCLSSTVIHSEGTCNSGFVGWSRANGYEINFTGCLFNGKLLQKNGQGSKNGGFIGWTGSNKTVTINNSICAPAALSSGETAASGNSATFARGWNDTTTAANSYYITAFGSAQAKAAHSVTAGSNVTISSYGTVTNTYNVSGITAYSTGLYYGGKFYAGNEDNVALELYHTGTPPTDYSFSRFTASAGTLEGTENPYTLTMPDSNVVISAADTQNDYTITTTSEHGTVIAAVGETQNAASAHYGDTVTLTVTANAGYKLTSLTVEDASDNNVTVTENSNGTYSFDMPASNVTVTADFDVESYFDSTTGTLTLKGTVLKNSDYGGSIILPYGVNKNNVLHIVVDTDGATLPQDSSCLFYDFSNVQSIDLTGADTSSVTNMDSMFWNCQALTSLDLSSFDTSSVTNMDSMFYNCQALTSLDLSGFDTSGVENMDSMFCNCYALETLDLSSFDTRNVGSMDRIFCNCYALETLDLSSFDTRNVGSMDSMFCNCYALETLDLSNFDTSSVTNMSYMFSMGNRTNSLTTIYVSENWNTDNVTDSTDMFKNCTNLTGGNGTTFDSTKTNKTYAVIDGQDGQAGYLTGTYTLTLPDNMAIVTDASADKKVGGRYVGGAVVTFRYTGDVPEHYYVDVKAGYTTLTATNGVYTLTVTDNTAVSAEVKPCRYTVTLPNKMEIVGTASEDYEYNTAVQFRAKDCYVVKGNVTANGTTLTADENGIYTLYVTDNMTVSADVDVESYFDSTTGTLTLKGTVLKNSGDYGSIILPYGVNKSDVLHIVVDTDGATLPENSSYLFYDFSNVQSIDLTGADTHRVTSMWGMFENCQALTSLDVSDFDTSNVTDMDCMFYNCQALETLDVSGFDTSSVTYMVCMFYNCQALTSLDLSSFDTRNVENMDDMFHNCYALETLDLSSFDTRNVESMENMFYNCYALEILDLSSFDTSSVTYMNYMFCNCYALEILDLSGFDTSGVENMYGMFCNCLSLTLLDLSNFDTSSVMYMDAMFAMNNAGNSLRTIYVGKNWSTENIEFGGDMFDNCTHLKGGNGTVYDSEKTDKTYARIDENGQPGYFTGLYNLTLPEHMEIVTDSKNKVGNRYLSGAIVTFKVKTGYGASNVKANDTDLTATDGIYTLTVTDNTVVSAEIKGYPCMVTLPNNMEIVGTASDSYEYGTIVSFKAKYGYIVNGDVTANGTTLTAENGIYTLYVTGNMTVSADVDVESYFDSTTGTLTLKGTVLKNSGSFDSVILPNGVNKDNVLHIVVDTDGATLPQDSSFLFYEFSNVQSIDLTGANTSNVTDMEAMFYDCYELTTLNLSSFDTSSVTDMNSMFCDCYALTTLNLSGFDTSSVMDMSYMFYHCQALTSLDLSGFDTSSVMGMGSMFENCSALTTLDLSGFDTSSVMVMSYMFSMGNRTNSLTTIYVSENWNTDHIETSSYDTDMFYNCTHLTGGNGTVYDSTKTDKTYARIDKDGQPGYLTGLYNLTLPENMEIVTDDAENKVGDRYIGGAVVTFQYTGNVPEHHYVDVKAGDTTLTATNGVYTLTVTDNTAVSAEVKPCKYTVTLPNNMEIVGTASDGYEYGTIVSFKAKYGYIVNGNVTANGTTLMADDDGVYTLTVTDNMTVSADVDVESYFDSTTGTLTLKGTVLRNSGLLGSVILPNGVNKNNVLHIVVDTDGATLPQDSLWLFYNFSNVQSIDLTRANTSNVTDMLSMFENCQALTSLDLSGFDTRNVRNMNYMFCNCYALETLDLSSFDTSSVTGMDSMFAMNNADNSLTTIYVGKNWNTDHIAFSSWMFDNCTHLKGGNGTVYDSEKTDKTYARIDKDGQSGYLTGTYTLTLPEHMEIVTDSENKVGNRYLNNAVVTFKVKTGYGADNVKANGTVLTATDGIYTLTVTDDTEITATIVEYTPVVINSVDINGIITPTTVYKEIYASADYTVPASPYLDGYTFIGWKVNNELKETTAEVQTAVENLVKDGTEVTVEVVYEKKAGTHTVYVTAGVLENGETEHEYAVSELVRLTASEGSPEQVFSYWTRDGKAVSYNKTYSFYMPDDDVYLSAVYGDVQPAQATGFIETVTPNADKRKISFVSVINVPENCTLVKGGLVATKNPAIGENVDDTNAAFVKVSSKTTADTKNLKYTWTKANVGESDIWYVRPYIVFNDVNGVEQTVYGDAVKADLTGKITE